MIYSFLKLVRVVSRQRYWRQNHMKLMNVGQAPVVAKAQAQKAHAQVSKAQTAHAQVAQAPAKAANKLNVKA